MDKLFGVPMNAIMVTLLMLFALCLSLGAWVFLRHRIIFRMGMRNVPRRPAQTTLIIVGLMLSTLIMSAALTTGDTLDTSITGEVYDLAGHIDERVVLKTGDAEAAVPHTTMTFPQQVAEDLEQAVKDNQVIDGIMPMLVEPVPAMNHRNNLTEPMLTMVGLDAGRLSDFGGLKDLDGTPIDFANLPANGVVMGESAADKLDAQVGDPVHIFANNQPHQLEIAAIAPDSVMSGMLDAGQPGGFALPLDRMQALLGKEGQISFVAISNRGGVRDSASHTAGAISVIDQALSGTPYRAISLKQDAVTAAEQAGNLFTGVFMVLGLFSIAAGVLLIFLIFVLLAAERKAEMGMARAVGMKRRQLTQMFLAEGIAYDLVSALVGAALGVAVAFAIAEAMGRLVGEFFSIQPSISPRSLIVAYTLGVIVTFVTITISSWRVSRLNIVAAIRDIPDAPAERAGRRWLILGILGVALGALLMSSGASSGKLFPFGAGISLIPLSLAMALRVFGVPARPLYTLASLSVLAYWLLPESLSREIFPKLSGGMEMFFVSGIMMVAAATVAIIWNAEILTGLVSLLGRGFSRWLPAVKTAVAYPTASKGRTGMTIAMFSLIVFSLVMMATINANFVDLFATSEAGAGWDVRAVQAPNNPIDDFNQALKEQGVDTSTIAVTGRVLSSASSQTQVRQLGQESWKSYSYNGMSSDFVANSNAPLQIRADGYSNDQAVWDAVRDNPNLAVIDHHVALAGGFGQSGELAFTLDGVKQGDKTMQPAQVEIGNPVTGQTRIVTIIGVLDSKVSLLQGIFTMESGFQQVVSEPSTITYYAKVAPDADAKNVARSIEGSLIHYGIQAQSIEEYQQQQSAMSRGFLYLIEGFMGLGLLVGIAALGVISFRSVVERRQQIGMLRAIGYQRNMVSASFLIESSMITILGVASGVLLGLALAHQLMKSEDFAGTGVTAFIIPWIEILAFIAISIGAALLMAYIPSRQAARVPIVEALRYS